MRHEANILARHLQDTKKPGTVRENATSSLDRCCKLLYLRLTEMSELPTLVSFNEALTLDTLSMADYDLLLPYLPARHFQREPLQCQPVSTSAQLFNRQLRSPFPAVLTAWLTVYFPVKPS